METFHWSVPFPYSTDLMKKPVKTTSPTHPSTHVPIKPNNQISPSPSLCLFSRYRFAFQTPTPTLLPSAKTRGIYTAKGIKGKKKESIQSSHQTLLLIYRLTYIRTQTKGVVTLMYKAKTMMVTYPRLDGLTKLDLTPGGGWSAGVMFGSVGGDDIFVGCVTTPASKRANVKQRCQRIYTYMYRSYNQ